MNPLKLNTLAALYCGEATWLMKDPIEDDLFLEKQIGDL